MNIVQLFPTNTVRSLVVSLLLAGAAFAQQQAAVRTAAAYSSNETNNLPIQKIGPDDLVGIAVYDAPEMSRPVRVAADGTIRLPMLRQTVKVAGLFPGEVEYAIASELKKEDVFVDPIVTVSVVEYRSRPISVSGSVKFPTTFQATGTTTLLDAIARAGGLSEDAGSVILVTHPQTGADGKPTLLMRRIVAKELLDGIDPEMNMHLEGGEEVRVPNAGKVYVVGNIKKPGVFLIKDSAETSVLKALAYSEGLAPYAQKMAYIYRTEGASGGKNEIPIELSKIMERKSPDVALLPNDVLYIPDNKGKRDFNTAMEKVLMIGGGVSSALVYTMAH